MDAVPPAPPTPVQEASSLGSSSSLPLGELSASPVRTGAMAVGGSPDSFPQNPLEAQMNAEIESVLEARERPLWPSGASKGVMKLSYTHDAMVDLLIANPMISQNDLADRFGYTASWVSQILSSDAFQSRLAERTESLVDPTIRATIEERFKAIVLRSLDILATKLNKHPDQIPDNLALRTFELGSRAAGYGAKVDKAPVQNVTEMHVHLESLGEGLTNLLRRKKAEVLDMEKDDGQDA
jgi:hypothetical protein